MDHIASETTGTTSNPTTKSEEHQNDDDNEGDTVTTKPTILPTSRVSFVGGNDDSGTSENKERSVSSNSDSSDSNDLTTSVVSRQINDMAAPPPCPNKRKNGGIEYSATTISSLDASVNSRSSAPESTSFSTTGNGTTASSSFLASMTFASAEHVTRNCDCDECGFSFGVEDLVNRNSARANASVIPLSIVQAVDRYKKQRTQNLKRLQDRTLVKRFHLNNDSSSSSSSSPSSSCSVWELTLPLDAEPLVEFGTTHRLVWIKRLPSGSVFKSIGSGIIGSSNEESQRKSLPWKQGEVWLVPSNGGRAVGWIHTHASSSFSSAEKQQQGSGGLYASLVVAKIPAELNITSLSALSASSLLSSTSQQPQSAVEKADESTWFLRLLAICIKMLPCSDDEESSDDGCISAESSFIIGKSLSKEDADVAVRCLS